MSDEISAFPTVSPPAEVVEVAHDVYAYIQPDGTWWINNAGFIVGPDHVVSIDTTSTERRTRAYLDAIAAVTAAPVDMVVNTHHHGDHTNGNCLLPEATIIGHRRCREQVMASSIRAADGAFTPIEWGDISLAPPTVTFEDRLDLHIGELTVEPHHIGGPAHTTGDVVVWIPERSVLFVGDLVFNGGTPFVLMGSVAGSLASLGTLRGFGAETVVPGHGPVGGAEVFDAIEAYLRFVQDVAARSHAAGLSPLDAARQTDLGGFARLTDPERLAGNLHRAYAELDGRPIGAPLDLMAAFADMILLNDGEPLRSHA